MQHRLKLEANMPKGVYIRAPRVTKYDAGTIHSTPYGDAVVLERLPREPGKQPRAIIKFLTTGSVANVQTCNLIGGKVRDVRSPSVYGVGYLGSDLKIPARGAGELRDLYDLWANMLKRAYGGYDASYGDVTVDVRWHSFTAFVNTVSEVDSFSAWRADKSMHLDKDIKVPGNRIYSKDTCMFVSESDNCRDASNRRWGNGNDIALTQR